VHTQPISAYLNPIDHLVPAEPGSNDDWYQKLYRHLGKVAQANESCIIIDHPDELKTFMLAMAVLARRAVLELGEGPYEVFEPFGDELPDLGGFQFDDVAVLRSEGLTLQGVAADKYGFYGAISVHQFPKRLRVLQLIHYADGGPPPAMQIMLKADFDDMTAVHANAWAHTTHVTVE